MRLKIDTDSELYTMLTLNGTVHTQDELKEIAKSGRMSGMIKDMKMNLVVASEESEKVYHLLSSGLCGFGFDDTMVYMVKTPVRVNDVEGKRHIEFVADLEFAENDVLRVDTTA